MKKILFVFPLLFLLIVAKGQVNVGGLPASFTHSLDVESIKTIRLNTPNQGILDAEDLIDDAVKGKPRLAKVLDVNIAFSEVAEVKMLPSGEKVYRVQLFAKNAKALNFYFKNFEIQQNDRLFIFNKNTAEVLGAYTSANNTKNGVFSTELIYGEEIIIEYIQAVQNEGLSPSLVLNQVGYAYRLVQKNGASRDFGDSAGCQVNANCAEGDNWSDQKRAVVRILIKEGNDLFWCTGTTVNNERQDCTPYLLTAEHCALNATASDMNQWIFYFTYEATACSNPSSEGSLASKTMTGASFVARSNDNGGDTGSDFMLFELNNSIPSNYSPFFAGWDVANTAATSGVSIHHPSGDIKKISTFTSAVTSSSFAGVTNNTHWAVSWAVTANGHGVTEQGSSGSPLFNQSGKIVGTLTGGGSSCASTNSTDDYGKISYHWTSNGTTAANRLKNWLDPDNTGITSLAGIAHPCLTNVSVLENEAINVSIFPNPTTGAFTIDWGSAGLTANVRVLDMVGKEMAQWPNVNNKKTIDLSGYAKGIYLVMVQFDNQVITKKIILK